MLVRILKRTFGGAEYCPEQKVLKLGGEGSTGVETLEFELPEEWDGMTVTVHVQQLDGTLPQPVILGEDRCLAVDRMFTASEKGLWMLRAMDGNGYCAMTRPARYECYETFATDGDAEITPSQYEAFVAQVLGAANTASQKAKEAQSAADRAESAAGAAQDAQTAAAGSAQRAKSEAENARTAAQQAGEAAARAEEYAPKDGTVLSVNGKGGAVHLNAEDVGAMDADRGDLVQQVALEGRTLTVTFADGTQQTYTTQDTTELTAMTGVLSTAHGGTGLGRALTAADVGAVGKGSGDYLKDVRMHGQSLVLTMGNGKSITETVLPCATADVLGGVKVGSGLTVDAGGRLSADSALAAYPVGSIFETVSYTSPASMFGGIWEEIAQGRTLMGATDAQIAGTTVDAGLPNIKGSFVANVYPSYHNASGAFTAGNSLAYTGANNSDAYVYKFSLDASRSNPIYGASDTVRPPAYIVHIWERMGYLLNIRSNPGSSLTITDGKTIVEDVVDDSGRYSRELPSTGIWTITSSKDESVSTKTCAVNTYGVYTVDISLEVFGVVWNYDNSSTALTRLTRESDPYSFVSTNITSEPVPAVGASYGTSPFDKYMPWKGMEEYNIVNSVVGVKQGEQGFSRTNDTVVFIPEFYYKVVDDATNKKRYFYISSRWISGFEKHPGSGRYVGKYNTASGYVSKTGLSPLTNITRATARTKSMEKGSGWYQYDYASWCAVVLLYIVEYADWNSSSKIGTGANKGVSGRTDSMTYHTGEASTTSGVQYRHIENVFGNLETFVDGINFSGNNVYVCTNPDKYADDTDSGYTYVGTKTGSNGYIKALGFSKTAPWAFYPTAVGGSNTTYITDQCWNTSSGWMTMKSQGTGDEGILYMSIDKNSNNSGVSISTRLMFVPSKH